MSTTDADLRNAWRAAHVSPLWESPTAHKKDAGPPPPHLWPWRTVSDLVASAAALTSAAAVERRVLSFVNPRPRWPEDEATVRNISAAVQILLPGESARPHRHSMNALRFVLQGSGAVTLVNGKPCAMAEGDLILTPAWTWHEHVHRGSAPAVWLDVLDVPFHNFLGSASFQPGPVHDQPATVDESAFAVANVVPDCPGIVREYSPVFHYPWSSVTKALAAAPRSRDRSKRVRYVNPLTGGPAMALLDAWVVEVERGEETVPFRTSSNAVCSIVEGTGSTRVGDEVVAWASKDLFTLPAGNWIAHRSDSPSSRLLVVSDREIFRRLDLLTEEWG